MNLKLLCIKRNDFLSVDTFPTDGLCDKCSQRIKEKCIGLNRLKLIGGTNELYCAQLGKRELIRNLISDKTCLECDLDFKACLLTNEIIEERESW